MHILGQILFCQRTVAVCDHLHPCIRNVFSFRKDVLDGPFEGLFPVVLILCPQVRPCLRGHSLLRQRTQNESCRTHIFLVDVPLQFGLEHLILRRPADQLLIDVCVDTASEHLLFLDLRNDLHKNFIEVAGIRRIGDVAAHEKPRQQPNRLGKVLILELKCPLIFEQVEQQQIGRRALDAAQVGQVLCERRRVLAAQNQIGIDFSALQNIQHKTGKVMVDQLLKNREQIRAGCRITQRVLFAQFFRAERLVQAVLKGIVILPEKAFLRGIVIRQITQKSLPLFKAVVAV